MVANNALRRLNKTSILVTDLAAQLWCEKQMELGYIYGREFTQTMKVGREMHADLQAEAFEALAVEPVSYADYLYKLGYEAHLSLERLVEKKICRELKIYGAVNGYKLSGKIDELRINKEGKLVVIEQKTSSMGSRFDETKTRPHRMQVAVYRKMLGEIKNKLYTYENFASAYSIDTLFLSPKFAEQLRLLGIAPDIMDLKVLYKKIFNQITRLPELSENVEVHYLDRFSGMQIRTMQFKYDADEINAMLRHLMIYWNGERTAEPVIEGEAWKCKFCKFFGNKCTTWWQKSGANDNQGPT